MSMLGHFPTISGGDSSLNLAPNGLATSHRHTIRNPSLAPPTEAGRRKRRRVNRPALSASTCPTRIQMKFHTPGKYQLHLSCCKKRRTEKRTRPWAKAVPCGYSGRIFVEADGPFLVLVWRVQRSTTGAGSRVSSSRPPLKPHERLFYAKSVRSPPSAASRDWHWPVHVQERVKRIDTRRK